MEPGQITVCRCGFIDCFHSGFLVASLEITVVSFISLSIKVVQYKQQSRLEEKRKKALDLQLDFIVGQTEKYSDLLSKSLAPTRPVETVPQTPQKSVPAPVDEDGENLFCFLGFFF